MDEEQLSELYIKLQKAYDNSCWDTVQETIDIIAEYIDPDDELLEY
jgi:hypothetical protein